MGKGKHRDELKKKKKKKKKGAFYLPLSFIHTLCFINKAMR
jgi:hypothetical protein